jgi:hypothetical protein
VGRAEPMRLRLPIRLSRALGRNPDHRHDRSHGRPDRSPGPAERQAGGHRRRQDQGWKVAGKRGKRVRSRASLQMVGSRRLIMQRTAVATMPIASTSKTGLAAQYCLAGGERTIESAGCMILWATLLRGTAQRVRQANCGSQVHDVSKPSSDMLRLCRAPWYGSGVLDLDMAGDRCGKELS